MKRLMISEGYRGISGGLVYSLHVIGRCDLGWERDVVLWEVQDRVVVYARILVYLSELATEVKE